MNVLSSVSMRRVISLALVFTFLSAGLPALPHSNSPIPDVLPEPASAETLTKPKYVSAAVMPHPPR